MKKTLKVIAAIAVLAILLLSVIVPSYAYSEEDVAEKPTSDTGISSDSEYDTEENIFSKVFKQIKSYATEIFCAMTFIGSLILAYAYKKGLLPLIEKALISIGSSVAKIKEKTESGALATEELGTSLTKRLGESEILINTLIDKVNTMNDDLSLIKSSELGRTESSKELAVIVGTQIDMLYDIFMTSALPQYQKDAVGERVAKMKEALGRNGQEE